MRRPTAVAQELDTRLSNTHAGLRAGQSIKAHSVGVMITDAQGRAQIPTLPTGRYYVFGLARYGNRGLLWNLPVDLKAGANAFTLNQGNGTLVD